MSQIMEYTASPTASLMHQSDAFVRGIRGPMGAGKTTAAILDSYLLAHSAEPCADGVSRTRTLFVRNTYPELKSTVIKTFEEWFGAEFGYGPVVFDTPIRWSHTFYYEDGREIFWECWFIALDRPGSAHKLKSTDVTNIVLSEASELSKSILDMSTARVGRYPAAKRKPKDYPLELWPSNKRVLLETNAMSDDHWWYHLAEVERPEGYEFFVQPGGFSENAENLAHITGGRNYYDTIAKGKNQAWIDVFINNQYGNTADGRSVYSEFNHRLHVSLIPLPILRGLTLRIGFDGGLTPAAVIAQVLPSGRVHILREVVTWGGTQGCRQFAYSALKPVLNKDFKGMQADGFADPGTNSRAEGDEAKAIDAFRLVVPNTQKTHTNAFGARRDAVGNYLSMLIDGEPALMIDPSCKHLIKACNGRYFYKRIPVTGDDSRYKDQPEKNMYSHVAEALQYLLVDLDQQMHNTVTAPPVTAPRVVNQQIGW